MAVCLYAYGRNGILKDSDLQLEAILNLLNNIPLDEVKVLDSILEAKNQHYSIREHYAKNKKYIEAYLRSLSEEKYTGYLDEFQFPDIEIHEVTDHLIAYYEKRAREEEEHFSLAYEDYKNGEAKSRWELTDENCITNKLYFSSSHEGFRISFHKDLVRISGPFSVFSINSDFLRSISERSRDYYHEYFKKTLMLFSSDFILYVHEWGGLDDENDQEYTAAELITALLDSGAENSSSIHNMESYYYQTL